MSILENWWMFVSEVIVYLSNEPVCFVARADT